MNNYITSDIVKYILSEYLCQCSIINLKDVFPELRVNKNRNKQIATIFPKWKMCKGEYIYVETYYDDMLHSCELYLNGNLKESVYLGCNINKKKCCAVKSVNGNELILYLG
jgi:hypothetical protein